MTSRPRRSKTCVNEQVVESRNCEVEPDCLFPEQQPRYDPKVLRDAVRVLSPFVRLIDDTNNPYARIVAREVCKTFYYLFHFNTHPADLIKTIDWKAKQERTTQLWNEMWLYVPQQKIREWISLKPVQLVDNCPTTVSKCRSASQQPDNQQRVHSLQCSQQCPKNDVTIISDDDEPSQCVIDMNQLLEGPKDATSGPDEINVCDSLNDVTRFDFEDEISQCVIDVNQFTVRPNGATTGPDEINARDSLNDLTRFDEEDEISQFMIDMNQFTAGTNDATPDLHEINVRHSFNDTTRSDDENEISQCVLNIHECAVLNEVNGRRSSNETTYDNDNCEEIDLNSFFKRQKGGNDNIPYIPDIAPSCSHQPDQCVADKPNMYEYYSNAARRMTPKIVFRHRQPSVAEPDFLEDVSPDFPDSFSTVSSCNQSSGVHQKSQIQKACEATVKCIRQFDDSEWNDNAFNDRDFIRILPLYQEALNNLEYISCQQREHGINMLDDIMSTFYHIHYELGDPRLKNDMLVEHVRLVTRNTWENYFYRLTNKMPDVPPPPPLYPPTPPPRSLCSREPSPVPQQCSRQLSPVPSVRTAARSCPMVNKQNALRRPGNLRQPTRNGEPNRPTTGNCVTQNPSTQTRRPFTAVQNNRMPQGQQGGATKGWAPKLKPIERPRNFKEFKAKPLPKFIRDKLNNRPRNEC